MKFGKPRLRRSFSGGREEKSAPCACNSGDTAYQVRDRGNRPYIENLVKESYNDDNFRTTLWTGEHLQLTQMTLPRGEDIGTEMHDGLDQLFFILSGICEVSVGDSEDKLSLLGFGEAGHAIIIPRGKWHNLKNVGRGPLKLFSVYAPKAHPFGRVDRQKPQN